MRIVTWNINSVRIRHEALQRMVEELRPDLLCLQETKTQDATFPKHWFAQMGLSHQLIRGQKSHNGVAILSRHPLELYEQRDWCGKSDCRHVAARCGDWLIHNFYVPAGGDIPDPEQNDKFAHKLGFLAEMQRWGRETLQENRRAILVGDLNIAPLPEDVWSHRQLLDVVSHTPIETEGLLQVQAAGGWSDLVRQLRPPPEKLFTWWSYRSSDWHASNRGRRLDHIWGGADIASRAQGCVILENARGWDRPSDHVPVAVDLAL